MKYPKVTQIRAWPPTGWFSLLFPLLSPKAHCKFWWLTITSNKAHSPTMVEWTNDVAVLKKQKISFKADVLCFVFHKLFQEKHWQETESEYIMITQSIMNLLSLPFLSSKVSETKSLSTEHSQSKFTYHGLCIRLESRWELRYLCWQNANCLSHLLLMI